MLNPDERFYRWDEFRERIQKLASDVEDSLDFTYKPYGKQEDEDAPFVQKLFFALEKLNDFAAQHSEALNQQFCDWEDEQNEEHLDEVLSDVLSWEFPCLHEFGGVDYV